MLLAVSLCGVACPVFDQRCRHNRTAPGADTLPLKSVVTFLAKSQLRIREGGSRAAYKLLSATTSFSAAVLQTFEFVIRLAEKPRLCACIPCQRTIIIEIADVAKPSGDVL